MPTYDYRCDACSYEFEELQSIKAEPLTKCPKCGKNKLKRLISGGAGIVFKGSGFYLTDYRSESYKKGASDSKKNTESATTPAASPPSTSPKKNTEKSTA